MRKTKIVCTLGPSTDKEGVLEELIKEGMNVARFNFSHGPHDEQKGRIDKLKELRTKWDKPIAALLDTKGPEIRIGEFKDGSVELKAGQTFTLTAEEVEGTASKVTISYKELHKDVKPGDSILIDDGLIGMEVVKIKGTEIICKVKNGGKVSNKKGVNVPGVELKMPFISEKDKNDILFGIKEGFDFIAASFTRTADDILEIKKLLADNNCDTINIIAKIENQQGVDNIDEIIAVSDGIMVARGDMGVEIPLEDVPVIQKKIIRKVNEAGKQVITATQMLDSMIKNPRPTRAEATDVANAIYQGTSAIMLSGETAAGKYPVEALKTMDKIAVRIEGDIDYEEQLRKYKMDEKKDMTTAISHATCLTAMELDAKAIITVSKSGKTARMVSKYHPNCMVIGCTTTEYNCRQLNMSWGIYPIMLREEYSMDVLFVHAVEAAKKRGYVEDEDIIVLTAGVPLGRSGNTNLIRTNVVKDF
jgi:pyruvate kinase